jgi:hypothetical protein
MPLAQPCLPVTPADFLPWAGFLGRQAGRFGNLQLGASGPAGCPNDADRFAARKLLASSASRLFLLLGLLGGRANQSRRLIVFPIAGPIAPYFRDFKAAPEHGRDRHLPPRM